MGYGDVPLTTPEVRLFACFHILVSVSWLAALVSSVYNLREKRSSQLAPVESVAGWKLEVQELVTACSLSGVRSLTMFGSWGLVSGIPTQHLHECASEPN